VVDSSFLNSVPTDILPDTDGTRNVGDWSSSLRWKSVDTVRVKTVYFNPDIDQDVLVFYNSPNSESRRLVLGYLASDSSTTTRNSAKLSLRGTYWDGSNSQSYYGDIFLRMLSTTPTAEIVFQINSNDYLKVGDNGIVSSQPADFGSLSIGGTSVIDSSRNLKNVSADASIITSGTFDEARIPHTFSNLVDLSGGLAIGGTTVINSSRVMSGVASVGEHMIPSSSNTYDLGSDTSYWRRVFSGVLRLVPSSAPTSPYEGDIYYNSSDKAIYYYDGSSWVKVGGTMLSTVSSGSITANGTEQTVYSTTSAGIYGGIIDTSNMASGDKVTLRLYVAINSTPTYVKVDTLDLEDAQTNPGVLIARTPAPYGFKVTLEQTAGTNRSYSYLIWKET